MLESGIGGERCQPRSSAVEISKRIGWERLVVEVEVLVFGSLRRRAVFIMPSEGSRPMVWENDGARARAVIPGPQPTSRRVLSCPPVVV